MFFTRKFLIYGAVGTFVTGMKLLALFLLRNIVGIQEYISITIAYIVAVMLHYFLNKHITFMVKERKIMNVMTLKYLMTLFVSFSVYAGNIFLLNKICGLPFYPSVVISLGISYIVNYVLYEKIVFVQAYSP